MPSMSGFFTITLSRYGTPFSGANRHSPKSHRSLISTACRTDWVSITSPASLISRSPVLSSFKSYISQPPIKTSALPAVTVPSPLCGARASPRLAAGFPLIKTEELPAATLPLELPQHPSLSVVTLPTVAAAIPLMKTSPEHPELISPENGSGLCGGTWPVCSPAVVPATASFSLAASGTSIPPFSSA